MISIQTNYASMVGQQNMNVNQTFQTKTIQSLTSGYRINQSGDDAAGLAVANGYRSNVAELTQGVINANSAVSQLQIMDGGLNNISNILDRLKTLATESSSSTFTGNRATLNNEYQSLLSEINRQASNIGLQTGGTNATALTVYLGGGNVQSNAQVTVDLTASAVDTTGLALKGTSLLSAGTDISGGTPTNLSTQTTNLMQSSGAYQTFTFNFGGGVGTLTATVTSTSAAGISVQAALQQLNNQINGKGLTATISTNAGGVLSISGQTAFTMTSSAVSAGTGISATATTIANNSALYTSGAAYTTPLVGSQTMTISSGGSTVTATLAAGTSLADAVTSLNTQLASTGVSAVLNAAGSGISFQSASAFTGTVNAPGTSGGMATGALTITNPASSGSITGNSLAAVSAVQSAVSTLGAVQGKVGAGENTLGYAISLANSQITNFSSAEAQLRDADVATEAANLTKASVLQQASIAAMAQANSAPQAVLKLLQ